MTEFSILGDISGFSGVELIVVELFLFSAALFHSS